MMFKDIEQTITDTTSTLLASQYQNDGDEYYRGEFPMTLWSQEERIDHNFLSAFALRHLLLTQRACGSVLPANINSNIQQMLGSACQLPALYQMASGANNWYHGKVTGDSTPSGFEWKKNLVLSIQDDLDDTAIAATLCALSPEFRVTKAYSADMFTSCVTRNGTVKMRPSSIQRMQIAGVDENIYMSWILPEIPDTHPHVLDNGSMRMRIPMENSVELVTSANVYTAVYFLKTTALHTQAQQATKTFINNLCQHAIHQFLLGNPDALTFAARYYPPVPFSSLSFLLQNQYLTSSELLDETTVVLIAQAVTSADPTKVDNYDQYTNQLYWLNTALWCLRLNYIPKFELVDKIQVVAADLIRNHHCDKGWSNFVFFKDAHIGDYGGAPYVNALALETLSLMLNTDVT